MENLIDFYRPLSSALGMSTGASDSLLHVHGGMVVLFLARIVTRRSLATWTPFLFVLAAAIAKEVADRIAHGAWRMPDSAFDVLNTIFWPFVLMVGLRWRRARPDGFQRARGSEQGDG
ncbi:MULTISPECIES: hypothetical protein [unclassified Sphingopyxis]|jgi:hypothetical protein|uniref:hypothetical protein n=1 Tax=unclassified Sphingopyxis TaxID=2614943 RepID=UPI0006C6211D|nr:MULTISPECIES: hypothetical protein [unclassified Sphingopyxis]USI75631.1 hypothetical protein KEC45_12690 [Sphingopyxis sp. USTB-05]GAO77855.1 hypothetical protein SC1_01150 [Sphingopyxis sp. C-1]